MPEQDEERQVIATISQRLTDAFTRTVGEEMARASKKGVPCAGYGLGRFAPMTRRAFAA